jgi:hypothetical protein
MMLAANDTAERADQLLALTRRIVEIVGEEVQALRERRLEGTGVTWDEKERLVHAWRLEVGRIKADPGLIAGIDAGRKAALKEASLALEAALEGHALALGAMKHVTEGLVRSIAAEIAAVRGAPQAYGRTGTASGGGGDSAGLAVNARV